MMLSNKKKYHNILTILIIFLALTPLLVAVFPSVTAFAEKPEGAWVDDGIETKAPSNSGTGFELDVGSLPTIISWVLEIVFLLIACVLWLIGEILNALTRGLIGGYMDTIILQGSGISNGTSPVINFYTFRLAEGNIYGEAVSKLYPLLAGVVIMLIVVRFFSGMSRAGFSTSSQESRSIAKDTLTGSILYNKTFETELERLMNKRKKEYSEEEEIFFRSIITPSKVFNSAMKNNYSYNHMLYDPKGDYLDIKVIDDIYYDYTHTDKDGNIKYYIIVEISPESIEIRKEYPTLSEDEAKGKYYESYEEFYEDIEDIKEENKLLQKLEDEIRKIQFLGLYSTFENNKAKKKTKTIAQRNYIKIN